MPVHAQLPDGTTLEFPDDTPDEVVDRTVQSHIKTSAKEPAVIPDVAKSVGSNLVGSAIDLGMTLPNLVNQAVAGPQLLGRGIADTVSEAIGVDPQPRGELWQPFYGSHDVEKAIGTDYEPQTTAGKVAALPSRIAGGVTAAKGLNAAKPTLDKLAADESTSAASMTGLPKGNANAPTPKAADDIKALSNQAYADASAQGGKLSPKFTNRFIAEVEKITPQTKAGKMLAGDSKVSVIAERMKGLKRRSLSLEEAQEIDEFLGDKIDEFTTLGVVDKQGKKLLEVQSTFRKMIEEAPPAEVVGSKEGFEALKEGRRLWGAQARLRDIEKIITRAEMTDNPATAIKTGFRNLYTNPSRMRGFSTEEKALIKKAAKSGVVSDILRTFGSRLIPIASTATGGGLGGMAASTAASMASRNAATRLQVNRANKVAESIANRAVNPPAPPTPQAPDPNQWLAAFFSGQQNLAPFQSVLKGEQ